MNHNIDKLIEYITILSNYEHGNYKLNDEEIKKLNLMNKSTDLNTQIEVNKIRNMSFSEREKYIESLKEKREKKEKNSSSVEEEIAITFGVDISYIKVNTLKTGKTLYTFYDEKLCRNVVLQSDDKGELTRNLQEIRKESSEEASVESEDILEDKRVKEGLEVEFVYLSDIGKHLSEIASFNEEKRRELRFLIDNATEFGIVAINLENVIGMDSSGKVFEVYFDKVQNRPKINNIDNNTVEDDVNTKNDKDTLYAAINEDKNSQLMQMLNDANSSKDNALEEEPQKENSSAKVLERELPTIPKEQAEE